MGGEVKGGEKGWGGGGEFTGGKSNNKKKTVRLWRQRIAREG